MSAQLDIDVLIKEMTLEEKATLVNGASFFGSAAIERLDIPRMQLLDGGTGINFEQLFGDITETNKWNDENMIGSTALVNVIENFYSPENLKEEEKPLYEWIKTHLEARVKERCDRGNYAPACLPPGILLGATWNKEVVGKVGNALGMEANVFGVHILLGTPNVNIHRDPLNGRLFEGYSEDPYLVSALAPELVKGVQEYGVIANVKHFAANNQETNRVGVNETISRRALEEIYLPGFKACVTDGKAKTVMSAYNKINGVPCTESKFLLQDKLRKEWGFDGFVMSDWGAVFNPDKALLAGNDLVMPGPHEHKTIMDRVKSGDISEEILDNSVRLILQAIDWLACHDNHNVYEATEVQEFTDDIAYKAAAEGIVMLKNDGIFPLPLNRKIILSGSGVKGLIECGAGSAGITTNRTGNLYKELEKIYGVGNVIIADTYNDICACKMREGFEDDKSVIIMVCSLGGMEGNDRKDMMLQEKDLDILNNLHDTYGLILNTCGPVDLSFDSSYLKAIWCMFLPGMKGARAMADIISGELNPSGKLPITFPARYEDTPTYLNFPGDGREVSYGEGIYVGYRYYDKKKIEPKYAFGYGLSYTSFDIKTTNIATDAGTVTNVPAFSDKVDIGVTVTNEGEIEGSQVVQVYISDPMSSISKPVKELKAFEKIHLQPGEEKDIQFTLTKNDFASYDTDFDGWFAEEGFYDIIIATSSRTEDEVKRIRVYLKTKSPYSYGVNSSIKTIYENGELLELAYKMWERYGLDKANIDNNYKYTAHKTLREILMEVPEQMLDDEHKAEIIRDYNNLAEGVLKQ